MTQKVPGGRSRSVQHSPWAEERESVKATLFIAWLMVYGVHFGMYVLSWVLVFVNPLAETMPAFFAGLVIYVMLGFAWGATLFLRLPLRGYRYLLGLRLTKDYRAATFKVSSVSFGDFSMFFGEWLGLVFGALVVLWMGVVYAITWPVALFIEIAMWADRHK